MDQPVAEEQKSTSLDEEGDGKSLSNSERLMKKEFESVFERMLYTSGTVNEFFSKVLGS